MHIADRAQPQTDILWDQSYIEPHWEWAETFHPDSFTETSPGTFRTSVGFEIWDSDWADDTPIAIFLQGRTNFMVSIGLDDSNCTIDTISAAIGDVGVIQSRHISSPWEYGVCRLDLATSGATGDRARVDFSIHLTKTPTETLIPLYSWWSPDREDNAAFTSSEWAGLIGDRRVPDYQMYRVEALVSNPNYPQLVGTTPLYQWYSPSRGDHFTTTDPQWAGVPGDPERSPDYRPLGIIGYVYTEPGPNRVPLHSWYDHHRGDNFITTQPAWHGSPGETRSPNYGYVRLEGYGIAYDGSGVERSSFTGRFAGAVAGDNGSNASVELDLVQSGRSVSGTVTLGPGLVIDTGCFLGVRSVPARMFSVNGMTSSDTSRHLETSTSFSASGVTIETRIIAELSADGEIVSINLTLDVPVGLEFLGCGDRTIRATLTRQP